MEYITHVKFGLPDRTASPSSGHKKTRLARVKNKFGPPHIAVRGPIVKERPDFTGPLILKTSISRTRSPRRCPGGSA